MTLKLAVFSESVLTRVAGPVRKIKSGIEFWPEKDSIGPARTNDPNVGPTRKPQTYLTLTFNW